MKHLKWLIFSVLLFCYISLHSRSLSSQRRQDPRAAASRETIKEWIRRGRKEGGVVRTNAETLVEGKGNWGQLLNILESTGG